MEKMTSCRHLVEAAMLNNENEAAKVDVAERALQKPRWVKSKNVLETKQGMKMILASGCECLIEVGFDMEDARWV